MTKSPVAFTLIEMMLSIFIFSIIVGAIFVVMNISHKSWHSGSTQAELQQEARKGISWMTRELRKSGPGNFIIANDNSTITFQIPVDNDAGDDNWLDKDEDGYRAEDEYVWNLTNGDESIGWGAPLHIFCRNPYCENSSYPTTDIYNTCHKRNYGIRYQVSNNQLLRRVLDSYPTGSQTKEDVLANNVTSIEFINNSGVISITLTAQKTTTHGQANEIVLNSQVKLRN